MKKLIPILLILLSTGLLQAQLNNKLKVYFNNPVNNALSLGINAVYLNNSMDDTLVAYINRAKYTIDIAVYNYQQSSGMADIAAAVNNAETRGITIRWIYDGSQSNSGITALNNTIHTLASPTTNGYGIMHNKFMVIDANTSDINDPLVWTGSTNWTKTHFNSNVNNTVIIQDKNLALTFQDEFNEMWGSASATPNLSNSKFGPYKTDNTTHVFSIGGSQVELYFSPSDGTNSKVLDAIHSANSELYFGMLTFSLTNNSDSIISKKNSGVYVAGIIDQSSLIYTPNNQLSSALGTNFKVYSQFTSVYHSKMLIVDPCDVSSDPTVITGSYNWTSSAASQNDENALIIHNDTVANIFQQSFSQNFTDLGGNLTACTTTGITDNEAQINASISPNPFNYSTTIQFDKPLKNVTLVLYNTLGKELKQIENISGDIVTLLRDNLPNGLYIAYLVHNASVISTNKLVVID